MNGYAEMVLGQHIHVFGWGFVASTLPSGFGLGRRRSQVLPFGTDN